MRTLTLAVSFGALLLTAGTAVAKAKFTPFKVPRDSILATVKTIALSLSGVPDDHPRRSTIHSEFNQLLAAELGLAGITALPSNVTDSTLRNSPSVYRAKSDIQFL